MASCSLPCLFPNVLGTECPLLWLICLPLGSLKNMQGQDSSIPTLDVLRVLFVSSLIYGQIAGVESTGCAKQTGRHSVLPLCCSPLWFFSFHESQDLTHVHLNNFLLKPSQGPQDENLNAELQAFPAISTTARPCILTSPTIYMVTGAHTSLRQVPAPFLHAEEAVPMLNDTFTNNAMFWNGISLDKLSMFFQAKSWKNNNFLTGSNFSYDNIRPLLSRLYL